MADLVGLVPQRPHDPEEERAPESEKNMVLEMKRLPCREMKVMHDDNRLDSRIFALDGPQRIDLGNNRCGKGCAVCNM